ncbi:MAG: PAS domain S-box protein, partial [Rhodospirillaceae bacterium]
MDTTLLTVIGGASAVVAVFAVAAMVYMTSRRDRMLANLADRFAEDRERQVRRRERHAATVVNSMTDGIVTTDGEGIIVDINPAAERIFHVRSTESCGKPVATILPDPLGHHKTGGLVAVLSQNDASLPATTARRRSEPVHHGQRGDGREVPISITVTRVEVEDGSLFVAVVRDITERVVADETESLIRAIDNHLLLGSSTEEICKEVCLRVGRLFSLSAIWVGLKEEGGRIQVVARSGGDVDRMGPMDEQWREEDDGSLGPAGKALVRGRVIDLAVGHGGAATDGLGSQAISGFDMAPTPGWAQPLGPGRLVVFPL